MSSQTYFFCGVGGSGMSALAVILVKLGHQVVGSDRAYDQGLSQEKFKELEGQGVKLCSQDGSGVTSDIDALIVSSAVEDNIPDVIEAKTKGIPIRKRAELLAELFNGSKQGIAVAGTSGKSTVTGMLAVVLTDVGLDPTVMNGGVTRNFSSNMRVGESDVFVTETDESDGSIALFNPAIAVLNNIALDHKSMFELKELFGNFVGCVSQAVVLNVDDKAVQDLTGKASAQVVSYAINDRTADVIAENIKFLQDGVEFDVSVEGKPYSIHLKQPGAHNVYNALACLAACKALGVDMKDAIVGLEKFEGIGRRLEVVGTSNGITVFDDFAHNPDKIAATLKTLKAFPGRLIVMFQPHGFGPLRLMGSEIAATFAEFLEKDDMVLMPESYYAGGTADRSVTSKDVVETVKEAGVQAYWFEKREEILPYVQEIKTSGDRIIVMGARDDTLSDFACEILNSDLQVAQK